MRLIGRAKSPNQQNPHLEDAMSLVISFSKPIALTLY
jgi:hypothetical protein